MVGIMTTLASCGGVDEAEEKRRRIASMLSFERCELADDGTAAVELVYTNTDADPYLYLEVAILEAGLRIGQTTVVLEDMAPGERVTAAATASRLQPEGEAISCELSFWSDTR